MNNPFPRAASGSYKSILVEGLNKIGEHSVADEFARGNMKLAIASTIVGGVKLFPELKEVCEKALNSVDVNSLLGVIPDEQTIINNIRYYFWGIANKQFIVASSNVDFIYDPTDKEAVAYNEVRKNLSDNEIIQPYFSH
jgi:hypothetical protein